MLAERFIGTVAFRGTMATLQTDAPWTWQGDVDPTQAAHEVMAHPGFANAARSLAENTLRWSDEDHALCALFRDAGHYVAAMSTLYLHEAGGLELSQLKQICAATGYASPGRARTLLQFLQHIGFVQRLQDYLPHRYIPTPVFKTSWGHHLQGAVAAAALLDHRLDVIAERLDVPAIFSAFVRVQARRLQALAGTTGDIPPFERIFMQRYAGLQIIALIVAASEPGRLLDQEAFHVPYRVLAARFGVSHMHLRRLFADAEAAGLLHCPAKGTYVIDTSMRETIAFFYAVQLAELATSALLTLEEISSAIKD